MCAHSCCTFVHVVRCTLYRYVLYICTTCTVHSCQYEASYVMYVYVVCRVCYIPSTCVHTYMYVELPVAVYCTRDVYIHMNVVICNMYVLVCMYVHSTYIHTCMIRICMYVYVCAHKYVHVYILTYILRVYVHHTYM